MQFTGSGRGGGVGLPVEAAVMSQLEEVAAAVEDSVAAIKDVYGAVDGVEPLLREIAAGIRQQVEETQMLRIESRELRASVERVLTELERRPVV